MASQDIVMIQYYCLNFVFISDLLLKLSYSIYYYVVCIQVDIVRPIGVLYVMSHLGYTLGHDKVLWGPTIFVWINFHFSVALQVVLLKSSLVCLPNLQVLQSSIVASRLDNSRTRYFVYSVTCMDYQSYFVNTTNQG